MLSKSQSLGKLKSQIQNITEFKGKYYGDNPLFVKWRRDTEVLLKHVFGENSAQVIEFRGIGFSPWVFSSNTPDAEFQEAYINGLKRAEAILTSMQDEISVFMSAEVDNNPPQNGLIIVEQLCQRFHLVVRQLRHRHSSRSTFEVNDEYDVQDLFHSLLKIYYDDIRDEEWTPSYAGGCSRVDFLLKKEKVVVEIKKTRAGLARKEIGEQLIIDIAKYKSHPDCKSLVCFVYDPELRIVNPAGLMTDLNKEHDGMPVKVIISPT